MNIFNIGVATEANNYEKEAEDEIWIRTEDGRFIKLEDGSNENIKTQE